MLEIATQWWSVAAGYFTAPAVLLAGRVTPLTVLAVAGMLALVAGVILAIVQRVARARWLALTALATLLAPIAIFVSEGMLGWLGRILASMFGVVALLVWIGVIAGRALNRLAIWLIGLGLVSFVAFFGLETLLPLLS